MVSYRKGCNVARIWLGGELKSLLQFLAIFKHIDKCKLLLYIILSIFLILVTSEWWNILCVHKRKRCLSNEAHYCSHDWNNIFCIQESNVCLDRVVHGYIHVERDDMCLWTLKYSSKSCESVCVCEHVPILVALSKPIICSFKPYGHKS